MGVSVLLVEQNARAALQVADFGYVLETGEISLEGPSKELANDPVSLKRTSDWGEALRRKGSARKKIKKL